MSAHHSIARYHIVSQFLRIPCRALAGWKVPCRPRALLLLVMSVFAVRAGDRPGNWTGDYAPCDQHAALLQRGPLSLGVRFSTSNRLLAAQFARAMDYWAGIIDMKWHVEAGRNCAIQVVDGRADLFKPMEAARAQFPATPSFQGWIAFNPRIPMEASDLFLAAVHELGHVLGLPHSRNVSSVMYFLVFDGPAVLDDDDLAALAARHTLRTEITGVSASGSR